VQQAQVERAMQWMQSQLMHSVVEALKTPWVLDCDTTIKPLYGHQAGAELGYNPHKPGRPSHAIHTYWIGSLRLVLNAQFDSGKPRAPSHSRSGLVALPESLAADLRPQLVRGDVAFGSEGGDGGAGGIGAALSTLSIQAAPKPWGDEAVESSMESRRVK